MAQTAQSVMPGTSPAVTTSATIHATALIVGHRGILIRGPSGSGKSRLALTFLQSAGTGFARLVGDDRIQLEAIHGRLLMRPATALAGLIEIRGLGIVRAVHEPVAVADLAIDLGGGRWRPVAGRRLRWRSRSKGFALRGFRSHPGSTLTRLFSAFWSAERRPLRCCQPESGLRCHPPRKMPVAFLATAMQHHLENARAGLAMGFRMVKMSALSCGARFKKSARRSP